ncbi:MAG: helix-turn-helix transcriptional regulator [Clostridiales bacterium]|nr:helix-turn-helix transcriptional regulator [Clostridiales bacterium]
MKQQQELNKTRLEIGMRIRRERLLWDLTQEELSDILGISSNYLGQIERGNRELSRNMEDRLCNLFHLTHDDLRTGSGPKSWPNRVSEAGVIFNDLQEEEVQRLLHSCSPQELQLCGHVLRCLLLYLRNPASIPSPSQKNLSDPAPKAESYQTK